VFIALVMSQPFRFSDPSYFYFDDFFYYLVPARSFLATGTFSFHPAVPTNGFQPLWMVIVASALAMSAHHALAFYVLLNAIIAALFVFSFYQATTLLREGGASRTLQAAGGVLVAALQLEIATTGMEVALTTPLLLWLTRKVLARSLSEMRPRALAGIGLLGSGVILSRLDAAVLLLPLAVALVWTDRPKPSAFGWLAIGALPLWAYGITSYVLSGSALPISGHAKMLKGLTWPTLHPLEPLALELGRYAVVSPVAFLVVFALAAFAPAKADADGRARTLINAGFIGVLAYYAAYCFLTDWRLWFWYKYPLAWLCVLGCLKMASGARRSVEIVTLGIATLLMIVAIRIMIPRTPSSNWIYGHARAIAEFEKTHPGNYAMGDCAGTAAYLLPSPVLQTEGLVGDAAFLEHVRKRLPLRALLETYGIDYYAAVGAEMHDGCYALREPAMAGPASPTMIGRVCSAPLLHRDGPLALDVFRVADVE